MDGNNAASKVDKVDGLPTRYDRVAPTTTDEDDEEMEDRNNCLVGDLPTRYDEVAPNTTDEDVEEMEDMSNSLEDDLPTRYDEVAPNTTDEDDEESEEKMEDSVSESDSDAYIGYTPSSDFEEVLQEPLLDIQVDDFTELWLIQLPLDQPLDDFEHDQKISLDLDNEDGPIGSIKTKSGKVYSMVDFQFQEAADITVFVPCLSGTKVAGKISRHVNLVRFPEPDELKQRELDDEKATTESHSRETRIDNTQLLI